MDKEKSNRGLIPGIIADVASRIEATHEKMSKKPVSGQRSDPAYPPPNKKS
jgi:hypothetical protein